MATSLKDLVPYQYNTYIEPFLGSGAVFFSLQPDSAILNDINEELIETYKAIKKDWRTVARLLGKHQKKHNYDYYYKIRTVKCSSSASVAARLIYLNRTCWNGLYRVNLNGKFNVPIGTKNKVILETDDFRKISLLLKNTELINDDFESIIDKAREGDFIFIDPPYTVKHNKNGFIKYNEKLFSWSDQERLKKAVKRASNRGAMALVMNANNEEIVKLYSEFSDHYILPRQSVLAANSKYRGRFEEIAIKCWNYNK